MTKKVLAVSLALCVMFAASSAIAQPRRPMPPMPPMPPHEAYEYCGYGPHCWEGWNHQPPQGFGRPERFGRRDFRPEFGPHEFNGRFDPEMPKEIRAIAVEVAKLKIDLDEALHANPMDKAKAFEIHDKIMKLEQDVERWKFVQRVDRIEAFRKQRELNRNRRTATETPNQNPNTNQDNTQTN